MFVSCHVSKDLWHNTLGHPADQVLNVLKIDLNLTKFTSVSAYEFCHRAKQIRDPFPLSDHKSEKLGELIHLDLWGHYKVTSREGFKYFLTVVGDFSKAVWVYFIKTKDEVFNIFVSCVKMIHNQFDAKVNTVRFPTSVLNATLVEEGSPTLSNTDTTQHQYHENGSAIQVNENSLSRGNLSPRPSVSTHVPTHHESPEPIASVHNEFRRSSRVSKLLVNLNDYVIDSKLKYGFENHVSYAKLNTVNY
ncbi:ribonuclease H-like domain-containing protein [Tanacetum coccineum]